MTTVVTVQEFSAALPALVELAEAHQLPNPVSMAITERSDGQPVAHIALRTPADGRAWHKALGVVPTRELLPYYTHVRAEGWTAGCWVVTHHTEA